MSVEVSIEMEVPAPNPGAMNEALFLSLILTQSLITHVNIKKERKWK